MNRYRIIVYDRINFTQTVYLGKRSYFNAKIAQLEKSLSLDLSFLKEITARSTPDRTPRSYGTCTHYVDADYSSTGFTANGRRIQ